MMPYRDLRPNIAPSAMTAVAVFFILYGKFWRFEKISK
jgi:hypothetical protein